MLCHDTGASVVFDSIQVRLGHGQLASHQDNVWQLSFPKHALMARLLECPSQARAMCIGFAGYVGPLGCKVAGTDQTAA